jgi:hypothetical protein
MVFILRSVGRAPPRVVTSPTGYSIDLKIVTNAGNVEAGRPSPASTPFGKRTSAA